ncbi:MAG: hypothetical protein LBH39_03885 [Clostridiales Family XIII bacterium]|jgi:hypothetical protein|nr:hypothetical protein [Clostridiales Family XIII bacterium]
MLLLFSAAAIGAFFSSEEVSEEEQRALAARPVLDSQAYFSGDFYRGWSDFIADHVPYRARFLGMAEKLKSLRELRRDANLVEVNNDIGVAPAEGGDYDRQMLVVLRDRLLEVFKYDENVANYYIDTVNRYAESLPEGIRLYSMLVPMQIEFDEKYRDAADSQKDAIGRLYGSYLPRVECVDAYSLLKAHSGEYAYFRTDHHWTALGAYYGMCAFAETAGFEPIGLERYQKSDVPGYLGYLYRMAPDDSLKRNPDTLSYYLLDGRNNDSTIYYYGDHGEFYSYEAKMIDSGFLGNDVGYGAFLGGDYPMIAVRGDVPGGRVLAVIKDSYGNALIPWLAPYFDSVIAIDPRTFREDFGQMLAERGVTDLLIVDYMKATTLPAFIDYMNAVLTGEDLPAG